MNLTERRNRKARETLERARREHRATLAQKRADELAGQLDLYWAREAREQAVRAEILGTIR